MTIHLTNFITVSVLSTITYILEIFEEKHDDNTDTTLYLFLDLSTTIIDTLIIIVWFLITMTMVIMYLRFSAPLSNQDETNIKDKFLLVFQAEDEDFAIVEDQRQYQELVERENKRHRIYQEMADAQIKEIIRTMISFGRVS